MHAQQKFPLYFFEVCAGEQTMTFHPTDIVDISDTQEQKRKALYCHASQAPLGLLCFVNASMEDFRGRQLGVKAGEGFVKDDGEKPGRIFLNTCNPHGR